MPSRREFLKTGVCTAALAGIPALISRELDEPDKKNVEVPFHTGIAGYTFLHVAMPQAIALMQRLSVRFVSLKDFYLPLDSSPEKIREVLGLFHDAGITVYAVGVIYMKTRQAVDQAFAYAGRTGVSLMVGVPDIHLLEYAEKQVRASHIRLAIHNHGPEDPRYPGPKEVYDRIRNMDPGMGLCLDIGHAMRAGEDPGKAVLKYADRLFDMHIKDVSGVGRGAHAAETGRGIIDFQALVRNLKKIRYSGKCSIEYEKDMTDPLPGIAESVGYFHGVIDGCA